MVPANVNEKYVIRFCVVAPNATESDIGKLIDLTEISNLYATTLFKQTKLC